MSKFFVIRNKSFVISFVLSFFLLSFLCFEVGFAQTSSQAILTWQARNFYPSDYKGKALATLGAPIVVSFEALKNNKALDLSRASITWFLDEREFTKGVGVKEIMFKITKGRGDDHVVRASAQIGNETREGSIRIPVLAPTATIELPYPNKSINAQTEVVLRIMPYFMNINSIKDLIFYSDINSVRQKIAGINEIKLNIGKPQNADEKVNITATIQNKINLLEIVKTKASLSINQ